MIQWYPLTWTPQGYTPSSNVHIVYMSDICDCRGRASLTVVFGFCSEVLVFGSEFGAVSGKVGLRDLFFLSERESQVRSKPSKNPSFIYVFATICLLSGA